MYGKVFDDIFDSSLVAEGGWLPTYIFMSMVAMANEKDLVTLDHRILYRKLRLDDPEKGVALEEFNEAIAFLEKEDEYSNLQNEGGRRIIQLRNLPEFDGDRGWFVVNRSHYRNKGGLEERREKDRQRQQRKREKDKENQDVGSESRTSRDKSGQSTKSRHKDKDKDINNKQITLKEFLSQCNEKGEQAFPENHRIWSYAEEVGITDEMIAVCWFRYKDQYLEPMEGKRPKKYSDWRRAFLNAIKGRYYKLWFFDQEDNVQWTSDGHQARKAMLVAEEKAA